MTGEPIFDPLRFSDASYSRFGGRSPQRVVRATIRCGHGIGLIHFVAGWAESICDPHRAEVTSAAERLGVTVRESVTTRRSRKFAVTTSSMSLPSRLRACRTR